MSDNTELNPGTDGDIIATEDPGDGVKIPVSKIRQGLPGIDDGDVSRASPMHTADARIEALLMKTNELLEMILERL